MAKSVQEVQQAAAQEVQQAAAQVGELLVVAAARPVEECLARADQCREPARGHLCRGNPRPGKEAPPGNQVVLYPDQVHLGRKAHHEIQPEHKGPA
jgi:hypothetical protein